MAPNLKKISLLTDDSFLDVSSLLAVKEEGRGGGADHLVAAQRREEEGEAREQQEEPPAADVDAPPASYWDWPAPSPAADLFSAEHLQSNLIRAAAAAAAAERKSGHDDEKKDPAVDIVAASLRASDSDGYWAERSETTMEDEDLKEAITVAQHHPLNIQVASDDYWRDARGERLESDVYWSTAATEQEEGAPSSPGAPTSTVRIRADAGARKLSDHYWDESSRHARTWSDAYWSAGESHPAATTALPSRGASWAAAVVSRAPPADLRDSHTRWVWSHERTESDRYWAWETPTSSSGPAVLLTC